jgi:Gdp/GTP exchange factor required for growth at low temperatures
VADFASDTPEPPEPLEPPEPPEPPFAPSPETAMITHFSTDVFDVLQTYRGLPLLEKLSIESEETTVIKMSLSADETAAPRDDPRFVIWGEIQTDREYDDQSVFHDSVTDSSVHSSSRRRSTKVKAPDPAVTPRLSSGEDTQKVIIAATIERWIAQLTSDLNYEELLDFFLTYRSYVDAVDLCHLLICRFHWALQQHTSPEDERVRRIVRVRTFVAIRYWLLTFFTVDFLPNRELRLLLANWLNTLIRDPVLKKLNDGLVSLV